MHPDNLAKTFRNNGYETDCERLRRLTGDLGTSFNAAWIAYAKRYNYGTFDPLISDANTCKRFLDTVERHRMDVCRASDELGIWVNWDEVLKGRQTRR